MREELRKDWCKLRSQFCLISDSNPGGRVGEVGWLHQHSIIFLKTFLEFLIFFLSDSNPGGKVGEVAGWTPLVVTHIVLWEECAHAIQTDATKG